MKIIVKGKKYALDNKDELQSQSNIRIISILDPECNRVFDKGLTLWFHDVMPSTRNKTLYPLQAMTIDQAQQVIDYVSEIGDDIDIIFVHCSAGICRSGAIGVWLANKFGDTEFYKNNPQCIPNMWVENLLYSLDG